MSGEPKEKSNTEARDVFISYRRKDGATTARLLCDALERRGISVFFDRESIEAGNFDDALRDSLNAAKNVLVVVSTEMFTRGLLPDGTYDQALIETDWVYEELRISLEQGKNIIPVFVNGVDGFPALMPTTIAELARKDALKLNHEHFDAELQKLIGRLITPKHRLLEAYLTIDKATYEDNLESLLRVCKRLSLNGGDEIETALVKLIRGNWERSSLSDAEAVTALIEGGNVDFLKDLCKELGLDNTGGVRRMKENIVFWLTHDPCVRTFDNSRSDDDRLTKLVGALAETYKSPSDRQNIIDLITETFDMNFDGSKRSSLDVFFLVFAEIDVEIFFENIGNSLEEQKVKEACMYLFDGDGKGRKHVLIDQIIDYVNYEYNIDEH